MSDVIDMHGVRVVAMKKGGSSMQHKAYADMMFDPKAVEDYPCVRWIVKIRNPMARLVSAYNHFIVLHRASDAFGPADTKFHEWLRWWLDTPQTDHDHHLKLQVFDLARTFREWEGTEHAHLMLLPLEKCVDYADHLQEWCYDRRPSVRLDVRHPHAPWWKYYRLPEVAPMVHEVRLRTAPDFTLWWQLVQLGKPARLRDVNLREMFDEKLLLTSELQLSS